MIIGITGTDGAGKGAAVNHLVRRRGFAHYSSRAEIEREIARQNLTPDRQTLREVANDLRFTHGRDVLVVRALERIHDDNVSNVVIESIRALAEVEALKRVGGILLAIDADPKERYRRISGRKSATDMVSFEEFLAQEQIEMNDPDPNGMQKAAVMAQADHTIMNNRSLRKLFTDVDGFLKQYG